MERDELIRCKDQLLNTLFLRREYGAAAGLRDKVLLVEGSTDQAFVRHFKSGDTRCLSVWDFMKARDAFSTAPAEEKNYNCKEVITTLLKHLAYLPDYAGFPQGAEQWPLYGMVDKDTDDADDYARVPRLFLTDTRDLETLMMSTDGEWFTRVEACAITAEDVRAALYLAVQLAAFRRAIDAVGEMDSAAINEDDGTVSYESFTEGDLILLPRLLSYICGKAGKRLKDDKLRRACGAVAGAMKKQVDANGRWKKPLASFSVSADSDFWNEINGHDVLSAIRYKNENARRKFVNWQGYAFNRQFELALSEAYDYRCLRGTGLYEGLRNAALVAEPE